MKGGEEKESEESGVVVSTSTDLTESEAVKQEVEDPPGEEDAKQSGEEDFAKESTAEEEATSPKEADKAEKEDDPVLAKAKQTIHSRKFRE